MTFLGNHVSVVLEAYVQEASIDAGSTLLKPPRLLILPPRRDPNSCASASLLGNDPPRPDQQDLCRRSIIVVQCAANCTKATHLCQRRHICCHETLLRVAENYAPFNLANIDFAKRDSDCRIP